MKMLRILGVFAILIGAGTVLAGFLVVMPRVQQATDQIESGLALSDRSLGILERHAELIGAAAGMAGAGTEVLNLMPETLISFNGTLGTSATMLETIGSTLDELQSGLTGAAVPD